MTTADEALRKLLAAKYNAIENPSNEIVTIETSHPDQLVNNQSYYLFDAWHGAYLVHSEQSVTAFADGSIRLLNESELDDTEFWGDMVMQKYHYPIN